MPKAGVVGGIFGLLLVGAMVYFSLGFKQQTCEVCMNFQGRTQCRSASGADEHRPCRQPKTMPVPIWCTVKQRDFSVARHHQHG